MRFAVASYHVPDPRGAAAGRILHATVEGLIGLGHEVRVWAWRPEPPTVALPSWCHWQPPPSAAGLLRVRGRALLWPRSEVVRGGWPFPDEGWRASAIALADEFLSFPVVAQHERTVLTVHHRTHLDEAALGRRTLGGVQERRAERRAARRAGLVLASSERVAAACPGARFFPAAYPVPSEAVPPVERPEAVVLADWRWPPNRWALDRLLRAWPLVHASLPAARLRLAGAGLDGVGHLAGLEALGRVGSSADLLAEAAVVPFPCPATSGPKVKVMEALAMGVPVLCTPAGIEGLVLPPGTGAALTPPGAEPSRFAHDLVTLLADPDRRADLGRTGRAAMVRSHRPETAAAARASACEAAFAT